MHIIIFIAKWILILEVIIILMLILISYGIRFIYQLKEQRHAVIGVQLKKILQTRIEQHQALTSTDIQLAKKLVPVLLEWIPEWDSQSLNPHWKTLHSQLITQVLHPVARKFATSHNHLHRYIASLCFQYGFDTRDETLILKLIHDSSLLVSLNIARIVFKFHHAQLIQAVIETFARGRTIQQTEFAYLITESSEQVAPIIEKQLTEAHASPVVKEFCFLLLTYLPATQNLQLATDQLPTESAELRTAILKFLAHQKQPQANAIIRQYLNDSNEEIRAEAASLLGAAEDVASLPALTACLEDPEWTVRTNAANALAKLGEEGLAILQAQTPERETNAYAAAIEVLTRHQHQRKELSQ